MDTTSEFQNKRDNPLFSIDGSPNSDEDFDEVKLSDFGIPKMVGVDNLKGGFDGGGWESTRGRSASRNSDGETKFSGSGRGGGRKILGRSLSIVDTGRRGRSPAGWHYGNSEVW